MFSFETWVTIKLTMEYDPKTGHISSSGVRLDCPSGRYRKIMINKEEELAHRVAWYLQTGRIPVKIYHINGDGHDNRLKNLREVTPRA